MSSENKKNDIKDKSKGAATSTEVEASATSVGAESHAQSHARFEQSMEGGEELDFTPDSKFEGLIGLQSMESDGEIIVVDTLSGKSIRLNSTGTYIWQFVVQGLALEEISKKLSQKYELDLEQAYEITKNFVKSLVDRGLVVMVKSQ